MPLGIPKVPFRNPGDENASWVDVYNRLYQQRLLFIGQEIDSEVSNHIVGLLVYLSIIDEEKDIFMFINSPGGCVMSGMAIFDTMQFLKADVTTVCVGIAASMASVILTGGEITKRLAFPHARIMMHQPLSSFLVSQAGENIVESRELMILRNNIANIYAERTGKPLNRISTDLERDIFMSAEEAKEYGIIDRIADMDL
uniref:ATP-dependent Clp protease proteolytic subunit n=1 Tax=Stylochaeton bogneri TaxID=487139 RepID=A0A6M3HQP3_9ARAE|nr:ATP-dependent Clp protease proteolytic subunit [Stylochaeton bogneri]QIU83006.1 ATP-dependent Clp protease proteolytic subunit [Stylochaeton bogneri]